MKRNTIRRKLQRIPGALSANQGLTNAQIVTMSSVLGRARLAQAMGTQFEGKRDMYSTLGYPHDVTFPQYVEKYLRQDISGKIVDLPPQDTWRKPPVIKDGDEDTSQPSPKSPFLQGLKYLIEKRRLWHYLQRLDKLAGLGRYGVMVIGTTGGKALSEPLEKGSLKAVTDIIYLSVFTEGSAQITKLETDSTIERYGQPVFYTVRMGDGLPTETVHWSRLIHVAEDLLEDDIYGRPRLERVFNRLEDLLKVIGGGSESAWKNMDRGIHADARDGFTLEGEDAEQLSEEIEEYIHGLRRFIRSQGVDIETLGSDVVDPSGLFDCIISLISAASDIPQRILLGSERGELASSQDQANWAGVIASRQTQHAEPDILRPFIERLIFAGALPAPSTGNYQVEWASLFELNELEKAKIADAYATAIQKVAPAGSPELVVQPDEFREKFLGLEPLNIEQEILNDEDDLSEGEGEDDDPDSSAM